MEVVPVKGQPRTDTGKKAAKEIRKNGLIPAVMYGKDDLVHFSVALNDIRPLIYSDLRMGIEPNYVFRFKVAEVELEGKTYRSIIKDYQMHPLTDDIEHIDFLTMTEGHPIKVEVPLRFRGNSPGVKAGGRLIIKLRRVKIKAAPENLIDELIVDISKMELDDSIRVRDVEPSGDIEILNSPGVPIATIEVPRALRSAAAAKEKEAAK